MNSRKLIIVSNHAYPFHVGGSETVIRHLSRKLSSKGWKVSIMSSDANRVAKVGDVEIEPGSVEKVVARAKKLLEEDRILIYSDASICAMALLDAMPYIKCKVLLCTVGCNAAISNPKMVESFKKYKDKIEFVTHSADYDDARLLKNNNIPFRVIPNAVDGSEFFIPKSKFKDRMNIPSSSMVVLMVANCFPNKGHEEVIQLLERNSNSFPENCYFILACSTPAWPVAKRLTMSVSERIARIRRPKCLVLKDASREIVCEAFAASDLTLMTSLKEVAPIVILESMACGIPWISFPVGNVAELPGGVVVPCKQKDNQGNLRPSMSDIDVFSRELRELLHNESKRNDLGSAGINMVNSCFNWEIISEMYNAALQ
jgi:glycosyltransferase involved in cell wall biosynthesis